MTHMRAALGRSGRRACWLAPVLALLGVAWGLSSASAADPTTSASASTVVLKAGITAEPDNLNPFIGFANVSFEIWALNYQCLFGQDIDNQPRLDLAAQFPTRENGGISADGKTWTIHIKPDVKWSDGEPLTADDVAFSYNYIIRNDLTNMSILTTSIKRVDVVDPTTVRIVCSQPKANIELALVYILPKHVWQNVSPNAVQSSFQNKPPIVGSGPYETVEWKKGAYIHMVRNSYYPGTRPAVDEIYFEYYTNPDTMAQELKAGSLDCAWGLPPSAYRSLQKTPGLTTIAYNDLNWDNLTFNCYTGQSKGNPVLRDWRFRQALAYAIDQQKLCDLAYMGYAKPGTTMVNPGTWSNPDYHWEPSAAERYTFDLTRAGQLLDQAGYTKNANGVRLYKGRPITLRLWARNDAPSEQTEGKLIAGWWDQLGLKIQLTVMDLGAMQDHIWYWDGNTYYPDFDMFLGDWVGWTDPGLTLSCFTTDQIGSINETAWSNARYDRLIAQQATTLDRTQRQQIIWRAQQVMYAQAPWLVLTYPDNFEAYNTAKWTGWTRILGGNGPAFLTMGTPDVYLGLKPATGTTKGGSSSAGLIVAVVAGVAVAIIIVMWLLRRGRGAAEEEPSS